MITAGIITQTAISIPFDNSTDGFVATNVQAAIEEAGKHLASIEVSDTGTISAPTGTDALMTTMSITPTPGTYICWFTCDINSGVGGAAISCSIYVNGVQDASSLRKVIPFAGGTLTTGAARAAMAINRTVAVTTGQTVQVRWSSSNAGPTAAARVLTMLRVA